MVGSCEAKVEGVQHHPLAGLGGLSLAGVPGVLWGGRGAWWGVCHRLSILLLLLKADPLCNGTKVWPLPAGNRTPHTVPGGVPEPPCPGRWEGARARPPLP